MQITVNIPDQTSSLDGAIAKQFADIQRQLMGLLKEQAASKAQMPQMLMSEMSEQQDDFLKAMKQLTNRLDSLETALLGGMRRFRTRTFGSNY